MSRGRKKRGRPISGLLLLDKPSGVTSNGALQEVKRLFYAAKAGHTGSLDPMATGVLPICFGEATKFSQYLLNAQKSYHAVIVLGATSDTDDADGNVVWKSGVSHVDDTDIMQQLESLVGKQMQVPPMYSALKVDGQRLYDLAREGKEVDREAREVTVYDLALQKIERSTFDQLTLCSPLNSDDVPKSEAIEVEITVSVSKGTYIRSLAAELGERLGVGGFLGSLTRTAVGSFELEQTASMESLRALRDAQAFEQMDDLLIPTESCLTHMQKVVLDEHSGYYLKQGNPVQIPKAPLAGEVCLTMEDGEFIGVGIIDSHGRVAPKRLVASPQ